MTEIQPVILAGGGGTRLWPLSREHFPKQFLSLVSDHSLFQDTLKRLHGLEADCGISVAKPLLICNEEHRFLVAEQARQISFPVGSIVLEPVGRNTAPALTCSSLLVTSGDPVLLVMPADHAIQRRDVFQAAVKQGFGFAERGALVTFGIKPTGPETGYGYIKLGEKLVIGPSASTSEHSQAYGLSAFVEKPDEASARAYLESGEYAWNSGMFMMKASIWLKAIARFRPDILAACERAVAEGKRDNDFFRLETTTIAGCPSDSIDYAVMEKLAENSDFQAVVLSFDAGWSDVGSWSSLWALHGHDQQGNVTRGDVHAIDSRDNVLLSEHRFVAVIGCQNVVVVETADAVMVIDKNRAQDVRLINEWLKKENRSESKVHRRVYRPWGSYEGVDVGDRFQVKRITVNPGGKLSLQMHYHRAEHWIVVRGTAQVTRGTEEILLTENQSTYIPLGVTHRLVNPGTIPLELIEVQSGPYLGEDDIVRFDDVYNRT